MGYNTNTPSQQRYERAQSRKRCRQDMSSDETPMCQEGTAHQEMEAINEVHHTSHVETCDCECQTEEIQLDGLGLMQKKELVYLREEKHQLQLHISKVEAKLGRTTLSEQLLKDNEHILKFYTGMIYYLTCLQLLELITNAGFPEWCIFSAFLELLKPYLPVKSKLSKLSQVHGNVYDEVASKPF